MKLQKYLPVKIGIFKVTPFMEFDMETSKVERPPVLVQFVQIFEAFLFNVSFHMDPAAANSAGNVDLGVPDENGTYSGVYGYVQKNLAEVALIPAPYDLKHNPGIFGPCTAQESNLILSPTYEPASESKAILEALDVFDRLTYIFFGVTFIIMSIILYWKFSKRNFLWSIVSALFTQNFYVMNSIGLKGLLLAFLWLLFSIIALYGGVFSASLAIPVYPPRVNELIDIVKIKEKYPLWFAGHPLFTEFQAEVTPAHRAVWAKAKSFGLDKCILQGGDRSKLKYDRKIHRAVIIGDFLSPVIIRYLCNSYGEKFEEKYQAGFRMFVARPFSYANYAFLMNKNINEEKKDRIKGISYAMIEFGYVQKYQRNIAPTALPTANSQKCLEELTRKQQADDDEEPAPVSTQNVRSLILNSLMVVGLAAFVLLIERLVQARNSYRKVGNSTMSDNAFVEESIEEDQVSYKSYEQSSIVQEIANQHPSNVIENLENTIEILAEVHREQQTDSKNPS